jgi:uncharacterized surface protein with fasciclin (FAS1) repeats
MIKHLRLWLASSSLALMAACGGGNDDPDLVTLAQNDTRFTILAEAVGAAGLTSTLQGPGPLTILAPTNDAFAALLTELGLSKEQLLADRALLTAVLTYHVLPAKVERSAIPLGKAVTTVQGGIVKVAASGAALSVQDGRNRLANITAADLRASNGVLHAIDKVLLPANRNIVQTAQALPDFSILVEAVIAADLQGALSAAGPLTVFAPTNAAFAALLAELGVTKDQLLADKALLTSVLRYHVVSGRVLRADVPVGSAIATLEPGKSFTVNNALAITDGRSRMANIVATDVLASNGVIHVIDRVILPAP